MPNALSIPIGALVSAGKAIYERWTTHRRDQFYTTFLEALQIEQATGIRDATVDEALAYLLADETRSEVIYDAFRRVCFTKSRNYGPRIIGLLTGELVNNALTADDEQEMVFAAAERMGDGELTEFCKHYQYLLEQASDTRKLKRDVMLGGKKIIHIYNDQSHEVGGRRTDSLLTPISPWTAYGLWAGQLQACGLLEVTLTQNTELIREDSERHIDYDQTWVTQVTTFTYDPGCRTLYDLYARARNIGG